MLLSPRIPWIDNCRTRRVAELLVVLWVLALADLFFTIWAQLFTQFRELNPLASGMLHQHSFFTLIVMKIGLTALGAAIFWKLRKHTRAELALWAVVVVYVMLTFRWSDYTVEISMLSGQ